MKTNRKYELFKKLVIEKLKIYLPQQYRESVVVAKINDEQEGITLKGKHTLNIILLNNYFRLFEHGSGILDIAQVIADEIMQEKPLSTELLARENIFACFLRPNKDDLDQRPHTQFGDILVGYKIKLYETEDGMAAIPFTYELAYIMGVSLPNLFAIAMNNSITMFPSKLMEIEDCLSELSIEEHNILSSEFKKEWIELINLNIQKTFPAIKLTTEFNEDGAMSMFYPGILAGISEKLKSTEVLILPVSTKYLMCLPLDSSTNWQIVEKLLIMANKTNPYKLSERLLIYDRNKKRITSYTK